jgi:hypothetical protein
VNDDGNVGTRVTPITRPNDETDMDDDNEDNNVPLEIGNA